jgi:8-oxo-dGTP diphosphatase
MNQRYCYDYPRPAVTTDCAIFGYDEGVVKILLIERGHPPFKGCYALPGGFLDMDETTIEGARRELKEETGLDGVDLIEIAVFSVVDRDPRGRTISVVYYGIADIVKDVVTAGDDARSFCWFDINALPPLAFDHALVIERAIKQLRFDSTFRPVFYKWFTVKFDIYSIKSMYEAVFGTDMERDLFVESVLSANVFKSLGEGLYSFNKEKYDENDQHSISYFVGRDILNR